MQTITEMIFKKTSRVIKNNNKYNKNSNNHMNISNTTNADGEKIQNEGQIELPGELNGNSWTFKHSKWSECD